MARIPDNVIEAMRGSHQLALFLRLDTDPPMRVWLGINDIPAKFIAPVEVNGATYLGGGILREIPNLEAVINGVADRVEFQLSGIDPETAERVDLEEFAQQARGKDFHVGLTTLDDYFQPMSDIVPVMTGRASFPTETWPPVAGTENPTVTFGLSVGFGITTRDRNSAALWSPPHHRAKYPTDAFCDNTSRLERGANPAWPRF